MIITSVWAQGAGVGGSERRMADAFAAMVRSGHEVNALFLTFGPSAATPLVELLRRAGCRTVDGITTSSWGLLERSDLTIAMGLRASVVCRVGAAVGLVDNLTDVRNGLEMGRSRHLWRLDRATQGYVDRYICNSRSAADVLAQNGISRRPIHVLRSALSSRWTASSLGPGDPLRLVMVGNDRPEKNQAFGVRVVQLLRNKSGRDYQLTVFTNDARSLREAFTSPEVRAFVTFVEGRVVQPEDYAIGGMLLHPSLSESAPLVVLEAQSQGLRVVASDVGDTSVLIGDQGLVVRGFDEHQWADAVLAQLDCTMSTGRPTAGDVSAYASAFLSLCEKS